MTRTLFFIGIICLSLAGHAETCQSVLTRLDETISLRDQYIAKKESDIAFNQHLLSVASGEARYKILRDIYRLYNGFNTDSAICYCGHMRTQALRLNRADLQQEADICMARCLAINGMYERAKDILLPMEPHLTEANRAFYYRECSSMYIWEALFTTIDAEKQAAWDHIPALRDSTIAHETDPVWRTHEQALLIGGTYPEGGIALLLPVLDTLPPQSDFVRFVANSIGSFYGALGQNDSALYYYAISAISDLEHGIMEHASLRETALLLFRQGDIERAFRYMQCCIEDAQLCKARLRTIEMAGDMPVIISAYRSNTVSHQRTLHIGLAVLLVFLLIAIAALLYATLMARRLRRAKDASDMARAQLDQNNRQLQLLNEQLSRTVQSLQESNRIRNAYVLQYMRECSDAFGKLETYHQQLLHVSTHDNYQKLQQAVRSTALIDDSMREFYHHFDETFLSLFPHFVEQMNLLLRPEDYFTLPEHRNLSTELRIMALIRLGVTDSEEIAHFLRLSTKTVYNYRTAIRNRALGSRDDLETQVRALF